MFYDILFANHSFLFKGFFDKLIFQSNFIPSITQNIICCNNVFYTYKLRVLVVNMVNKLQVNLTVCNT